MGLASASGSRPSAQALAGQQPSSPGAWRGSGDAHCCRLPVLVAPRLGCQSWYRASIQGPALMTPAARQRQRDLRIQQRGKCIQPSILRIWPFPFKDRWPFVVWCFLLLIYNMKTETWKKKNKRARDEWRERVSKAPSPHTACLCWAELGWGPTSLVSHPRTPAPPHGIHPAFLCHLLSDCPLQWVPGPPPLLSISSSSSSGLPTALPLCPGSAATAKVRFPRRRRLPAPTTWDCSR